MDEPIHFWRTLEALAIQGAPHPLTLGQQRGNSTALGHRKHHLVILVEEVDGSASGNGFWRMEGPTIYLQGISSWYHGPALLKPARDLPTARTKKQVTRKKIIKTLAFEKPDGKRYVTR